MNRLLITFLLLIFLPCACYASGSDNGLEYSSVLTFASDCALATAALNILSYIAAARPHTLFTLGLLWTCLVLNIICLGFCVLIMFSRYQQHIAYQADGEGMDKIGYDDFNSKAIIILFIVIAAIVVDIVLIVKKRNDRKSREAWMKR